MDFASADPTMSYFFRHSRWQPGDEKANSAFHITSGSQKLKEASTELWRTYFPLPAQRTSTVESPAGFGLLLTVMICSSVNPPHRSAGASQQRVGSRDPSHPPEKRRQGGRTPVRSRCLLAIYHLWKAERKTGWQKAAAQRRQLLKAASALTNLACRGACCVARCFRGKTLSWGKRPRPAH